MSLHNRSCYPHQMAEYRISIYGRKKSEWDQMASWIVNNELYSENVVWLIQVIPIFFCCFLSLASSFFNLFISIANSLNFAYIKLNMNIV